MMGCRFLLSAATLLAVMLAPGGAEAQFKKKKDSAPVASDGGSFDASGRYVLGESELKLDCKKLNGRMNLRILQVRAELADTRQPSAAAQALQSTTNPALKLMYGGASGYGTDRGGQLQRDRAVLEAYNGQLAAKNCPTYDLAAELKKGPSDPPPGPIRKK